MTDTLGSIADSPDIPRVLYESLHDANQIAGEHAAVCLTYLAAQTRRFDLDESGYRPVGLMAYGQSSSGKSYSQNLALKTVWPDDVVKITGMSDKLLTRKHTEDFAHKIVVLGEAEAMASAQVAYFLRILFDAGHLIYEVLEEALDDDSEAKIYKPKHYELGPGAWFSLMTSSTKEVNPENATRQLTVYSDDSDEQTRRVVQMAARKHNDGSSFDFEPWQDFDAWQSEQPWGAVNIPFLENMSDGVRIIGPALRRTFDAVTTLIAAHASLHRNTRKTDSDGRIVATGDDYSAVRAFVEPFLAREAGAKVPAALQAVVKAVGDLAPNHPHGVPAKVVEGEVKSSSATVYRALKEASDAGLIVKTGKYPHGYYPVDGLAATDISCILPPLELLLWMSKR